MRRSVLPRGAVISEVIKTDVVVVGSGMAGLYTALNLDFRLSCLIVTKESFDVSNSWMAQGGIAAAIAPDDRPQIHLQDTLVAGAGLCDEEAVRVLVDEGPDNVDMLRALRVPFDLNEDGDLQIGREGGHTRNRIVHAGGDATGRETVKVLAVIAAARPNIEFRPHSFLVDILTENGRAVGVLIFDGAFRAVLARGVVLCSGGIGQVYAPLTTNPSVATGEGLAAALRAGARTKHMEFVQFHPTALYIPGQKPFLISEAVRGEGATLQNAEGMRFMEGQHPMAELAPRDIVARAIDREMKKTGAPCVYLDIRQKPAEFLKRRFPTIYNHCARLGIEIARDLIPVRPVQHYLVGGLQTDLFAQTNVPGLYACGEVSYTGVHGANRLASNSMLECLVFGARAARHISGSCPPLPEVVPPLASAPSEDYEEPQEARARVGEILNRDGGIVRNTVGLMRGVADIGRLIAGMEDKNLPGKAHWEAYGMAVVGGEILRAAGARTESVGAHYREEPACT